MKKLIIIILVLLIGLASFTIYKLNTPHYNSCGFVGSQPSYIFEEDSNGCRFEVRIACGDSSPLRDECSSFSKVEKKFAFENYLEQTDNMDLVSSYLVPYKSKDICDFTLDNLTMNSSIGKLQKVLC